MILYHFKKEKYEFATDVEILFCFLDTIFANVSLVSRSLREKQQYKYKQTHELEGAYLWTDNINKF